MKIGCCAPIERYDAVAAAGFGYIELPGGAIARLSDAEFAQWREKLDAGPIPCLCLNAAVVPEVKICGPAFSLPAAAAYCALLADRAARLGANCIGVGSPKSRDVPPDFDMGLAWRQTGLFLETLCEAAGRHGIRVLWEPLNASETRFGVDSLESAQQIELLRRAGRGNPGLLGDLYHMVYKRESVQTFETVLPLVGHLHIASIGDGKRGFATQADAAELLSFIKSAVRAGRPDTISAETFSGSIETDGAAFVKLLRGWLKEEG